MIAIVNVTKHDKPTGIHTYEVWINRDLIATFKHRREEGLSRCLQKAALAVEKAEQAIASLT